MRKRLDEMRQKEEGSKGRGSRKKSEEEANEDDPSSKTNVRDGEVNEDEQDVKKRKKGVSLAARS